jgi:hypothetical protein
MESDESDESDGSDEESSYTRLRLNVAFNFRLRTYLCACIYLNEAPNDTQPLNQWYHVTNPEAAQRIHVCIHNLISRVSAAHVASPQSCMGLVSCSCRHAL